MNFCKDILKDFYHTANFLLTFQEELFFRTPLSGLFLVCRCLLSCYIVFCFCVVLQIKLHFSSVESYWFSILCFTLLKQISTYLIWIFIETTKYKVKCKWYDKNTKFIYCKCFQNLRERHEKDNFNFGSVLLLKALIAFFVFS